MDRMNITLFFISFALCGWLFTSSIKADESYNPSYSATPSATVKPTPQPTPQPSVIPTLVPGSCTIKAVKAAEPQYPTNVSFTAKSRAAGKDVDQFAYDFGDGTTATGSGTVVHQYNQAGTYAVVADPILDAAKRTNPCKITISLKGGPVASVSATPIPVVMEPVATTAAIITQQPETGPSSVYWMSLGGLFIIWLGAEWWYRQQQLPIG